VDGWENTEIASDAGAVSSTLVRLRKRARSDVGADRGCDDDASQNDTDAMDEYYRARVTYRRTFRDALIYGYLLVLVLVRPERPLVPGGVERLRVAEVARARG
jgi:hypothetical protein